MPCLAGILAQQLFVLMQYGVVTCRLIGKKKVERRRELSDIVRRRHRLERRPGFMHHPASYGTCGKGLPEAYFS